MRFRALLFSLFVAVSTNAQTSGTGKAHISIPGVKGALEIDAGQASWEAHVRADGKETQMKAMNRADHLLVTAFLQQVKFGASAEKCRAEWWSMTAKSTPFKLKDVVQSERNGSALVEYIIPEFKGMPVRQKSVHAYVGSGDLCAEVHLSKVQFVAEDQQLFDEVLASIHLLPDATAAEIPRNTQAQQGENHAEVNQLFGAASRLYLDHNYAAAAQVYEKTLTLEKQNAGLSQTYFRVLIDNLGMSYGMTGHLPEAKKTFEYGITRDPEYPLFYYNLACTYGEMGRMNESLEQLRLTYKYKANTIPGESLPDPLTDDSFHKFVKDKAFVSAVRQMQQQ
jgi:tetratricopeptide (TPR) repeat protein